MWHNQCDFLLGIYINTYIVNGYNFVRKFVYNLSFSHFDNFFHEKSRDKINIEKKN